MADWKGLKDRLKEARKQVEVVHPLKESAWRKSQYAAQLNELMGELAESVVHIRHQIDRGILREDDRLLQDAAIYLERLVDDVKEAKGTLHMLQQDLE